MTWSCCTSAAWSAPMLFEGWAKDEKEAVEIIRSGEIRIDSALNHNTVGAGTGIITKSVAMNVIEDRRNHHPGRHLPGRGALPGRLLRLGPLQPRNRRRTCAICARSSSRLCGRCWPRGEASPSSPFWPRACRWAMRTTPARQRLICCLTSWCCPGCLKWDLPKEQIMRTVKYIVETPRFFHCYGQGASRAAAIAADARSIPPWSPRWRETAWTFRHQDRLAARTVVYRARAHDEGPLYFHEVHGKGSASMAGRQLRGGNGRSGRLCGGGQPHRMQPARHEFAGLHRARPARWNASPSPKTQLPHSNLDFDPLPVGIDIRLVLKTGVCPAIHGGMFNHEGGLIGAGMARVPMECFPEGHESLCRPNTGP